MEGWGSTIELHPLVKLVRHPGFGRLSINRPPIKTKCEPSTRTWSIHRKSYWRSASVSNPENSPMLFSGNLKWILREWGVQDSNLRRLSQQIYSLSRLTASVTPLKPHGGLYCFEPQNTAKASGGVRTHDLRFTKPLLCQLSYVGALFRN